MNTQNLIIKSRLYLHSNQQSNKLSELLTEFTRACNYGSHIFFNNLDIHKAQNLKWNKCHKRKRYNNDLTAMQLQKKIYYHIRHEYHLKSELACEVPRVVLSRYKAVKTQLGQQPKSYQDRYTRHWHHYYKRLCDLWHPITFYTPQALLTRGRDWSFTHDKDKHKVLSLPTLTGRTKVNYFIPDYFKKYLVQSPKFGTAQLLHKQDHWVLHIAIQIAAPEVDKIKHVVGSDRGLNQIVYTYDGHHSYHKRGYHMKHLRAHYLKQRSLLQHEGSKAAKRKLHRISGRENRWMNDVNFQIIKALVQHYGRDTVYGIEDLRSVRFTTENVSKRHRCVQVSWPFYDLGNKWTYKANLHRSQVIHVNANYTSQRCPNCGYVLAKSRHHHIHTYICKHCGYTTNDDRIGGMNIYLLTNLKAHRAKDPRILENGKIVKNYKRYKKRLRAKAGKQTRRL